MFGALKDASLSGVYWALLAIGSTFILLLVVGVVLYLILSIKAINLTRRQSNFIDSVTHELKSPIASMKLYLQTLNRHQVSQELQADFHRFMLEDLERLDHLINQMLDAGRLDAERPDGEEEDVELAELLRDCAAGGVHELSRAGRNASASTCSRARCTGRRVDLDIIFRNLIDNAVKYAGAAAAGRGRRCGRSATARCWCGSPTTAAASPRTCGARSSAASCGWAGTGAREARHRPGAVHRPHAGPPPPRPHPRPRSGERARQRVRSATAGEHCTERSRANSMTDR